jgi:hypothetical protein
MSLPDTLSEIKARSISADNIVIHTVCGLSFVLYILIVYWSESKQEVSVESNVVLLNDVSHALKVFYFITILNVYTVLKIVCKNV